MNNYITYVYQCSQWGKKCSGIPGGKNVAIHITMIQNGHTVQLHPKTMDPRENSNSEFFSKRYKGW